MDDPFRVLLVNPRATYANEIAQKCYPPTNLLYLAAVLRRAEFDVRVLEANAFSMGDQEIEAAVAKESPDLVGFPLYSEILKHVHDLTTMVRRLHPGAKIVLGGPHATAVPEVVLSQFPAVDMILRHEAEDSLVALCSVLTREKQGEAARGAPNPETDLAGVPGLSYRSSGGYIRHNPDIAQRPDVNDIPFPARDLVEDAYAGKRYYTIMVRDRPVDSLMTSRGCPFRCGFCYNMNFRYRGRSPESVLEEMIRIRKRGIRNIEIVDDHFTVDRTRAMKIFGMILEEELDVSFRIKSRVNVVDEEFLKKAREAGVYQISYGTESGVQKILDAMNKRIKVDDIARACELTQKYGMACHSSWVIGYPPETPETIRETVDFVTKIKPTTANFAILRPYPQTEVYREAKDSGTLEGDWDPSTDVVPWVRLPWTPSRRDLEAVLEKALRKVYYRPYYLWNFGREIVRNANWTLARYAAQELKKTIVPRG
jgi:radical SAM superfamily enzyme YgiQ (UPF0313 family)